MITSLELINFKKHRNLKINFTEGMNAIKGVNEGGKSTILEAIGYGYWGTRFLPESLDETVTWGENVNSLRVNMGFLDDGAEFTISRGKSGAELNGPGVKVSGHDAVTKYIEERFKVTMAMAKMILVSAQDEVRGSIEAGAVQLIEKLANMKFIDDTINNIQTHLSAGNTKALDNQVATLEASLVKPEPDDADHVAQVDALVVKVHDATVEKAAAEDLESFCRDRARAAETAVAQITAAEGVHRAAAERLAGVQRDIQRIAAASISSLPDVEALEQAAVVQKQQQATAKAWQAWERLPAFSHQWDSREQAELEIASLTKQQSDLRTSIQNIEVAVGRKEATLITQTACGLCGKDLSEVPEVVATNTRISQEIDGLLQDKQAAYDSLQKVQQDLTYKKAQHNIGTQIDTAKQSGSLDGYVLFGTDKWPSSHIWQGPELSSEPDNKDYPTLIRKAKAEHAAADTQKAQFAALQAEEVELKKQVESFVKQDIAPHQEVIAKWQDASAAVTKANRIVTQFTQELNEARNQLNLKQQAYLLAVQNYDTGMLQLAELKKMATDMNDNNVLIKKLRDLRPVVAKRLWNTVLASVSGTFSQIRGVPSKVTRTEDSFLIDGRPLGAFSGSTKDSLGLAIRIALQKTFLPSIDFIIVDEPAKGMDRVRETDMLAVLSTAGFAQTFVVTHSDLADAYAANLIQVAE